MSDLISRQAAIKAIEDLQDCYNGFSDTYDKACIIGVIEEVPTIEAEPFKAFCPHCGARMDLIGEDKSHPFAESVMMGIDGGENG